MAHDYVNPLLGKGFDIGVALASATSMWNSALGAQLFSCTAPVYHRNNIALRPQRAVLRSQRRYRRRQKSARGVMTLFYKGVGVGTHFHTHNPRIHGISPRAPGIAASSAVMMRHVTRATTISPYVSLTRSYGVAEMYAREASSPFPTPANPAFVFEIDIPDPAPTGIFVIDPVKDIAATLPSPVTALSYFHDGDKDFILGVASPALMSAHLLAPIRQPPGSAGAPRSANLTPELETLVRALRDAEVLVLGTIPAGLVSPPHAIV